jgi:hypothetical protein
VEPARVRLQNSITLADEFRIWLTARARTQLVSQSKAALRPPTGLHRRFAVSRAGCRLPDPAERGGRHFDAVTEIPPKLDRLEHHFVARAQNRNLHAVLTGIKAVAGRRTMFGSAGISKSTRQ